IHWIGAGLLALILLLLLLWKRRRDQQPEKEVEFEDDDTILVVPPESTDKESVADEVTEVAEEVADTEEEGVEAETGDVVGEADIYIAYGKFDQAEEMLLKALEQDPESSEIRLKLLEVYSQTQEAEKFDQHYARLIALASPMVLARATELREQIPGVG